MANKKELVLSFLKGSITAIGLLVLLWLLGLPLVPFIYQVF
jgi:hypothetical protein